MENLFIVVGLGNPGSRYEKTRHNVGFEAVDLLAEKSGISITKLKHKALLGEGHIEGERVLLVKPQTFMNLSGESVLSLVEWFKVPLEKLIVIYDDIDLQPGKVRVRPKGSSGTHNGMRSILYNIQSEDFTRIRIGIGKPPEGWELADYVLGRIGQEEKVLLEQSIRSAAEAVPVIIKSGVETAMNNFNR